MELIILCSHKVIIRMFKIYCRPVCQAMAYSMCSVNDCHLKEVIQKSVLVITEERDSIHKPHMIQSSQSRLIVLCPFY